MLESKELWEAYKFGDEARAALEGELMDLGLVLFLVFCSWLFRHVYGFREAVCGAGRAF